MPVIDSTFDNCAEFVPTGWMCPSCKTVHAPFVNHCDCQQTKKHISTGSTSKFVWAIANPFFSMAFEDSPSFT